MTCPLIFATLTLRPTRRLSLLLSANRPGSLRLARDGLIENGPGLQLRVYSRWIWRKWLRTGVGFSENRSLRKKLRSWSRSIVTMIVLAKLIWHYCLLGRGGVTHNMLEDIHSHWKRAEAIRIKCLGVPTLDMDNVCSHLKDKSGGEVVYRHINILLLYRGRNYDPKSRPTVPVMLWKPLAPIYPKLVKNVADGLTFEETKAMRNKGLNAPPLTKLSRNGVYVNVVDKVRAAFETEEVVRLDCTHVGTSDCKRIGVKLRDLVPCVPILFKDEQIILWRGKKDEVQNSGS
ncbi:PREDICTED: CRS2-associated factor 2, mitochondrial isoform X2 [Nicotiana attenuata]|uniref:CRS2-associated factor 2, mitochondrial isoform X2 n=1 Tax=Nicotiana attenuata TaxID=49451 RepID=UPI000905A819|nr:PREDICTED: CRS2-associated factor 2, mitochondrial isoform X2 [Nicotiana attenuata]